MSVKPQEIGVIMTRGPARSTRCRSSAASDMYKGQLIRLGLSTTKHVCPQMFSSDFRYFQIFSSNLRPKVWHQQDLVTNAISSEMIKSMQSSWAKLCILLIIADDIAFLTCCHILGLKSDKSTSNQINAFAGIHASECCFLVALDQLNTMAQAHVNHSEFGLDSMSDWQVTRTM